MLELLQSTLDGYDQGSWKLTLDDYPVKHEDLITFFAPLARMGSTTKTARSYFPVPHPNPTWVLPRVYTSIRSVQHP